jgi:16S rRNA (uracil1498-N3)-methyltransferase
MVAFDRVELFDGKGGIVSGQLSSISRTVAEVVTAESLQKLSPVGPYWHVAAAFCEFCEFWSFGVFFYGY